MKTKIGILGGGQLGLMFLENAVKYPVHVSVMDPDEHAPCKNIAHHFYQGSFRNFEDVLHFGRNCEVVGIEIEHVNVKALQQLEKEGITVIPRSSVIETIQDKGLQKLFYQKNNIPTAPFLLVYSKEEFIKIKDKVTFPFVQKSRKDGYDGKGVQVIQRPEELDKYWDVPSIIEQMADIELEMAVIVCVDEQRNSKTYPPVEMVFNPQHNLLDYLVSPSEISETIQKKMIDIASNVALSFQSPGVFAVEFFINKDQSIWVNETACRVHNSGHHTIESSPSSQFDQMLRILTGMPLGDTSQSRYAGIYNLVGSDGHMGKVVYEGIDEVESTKDVYVHLYGKLTTKPGRKMGHVTALADNREELLRKLEFVKSKIKVVS